MISNHIQCITRKDNECPKSEIYGVLNSFKGAQKGNYENDFYALPNFNIVSNLLFNIITCFRCQPFFSTKFYFHQHNQNLTEKIFKTFLFDDNQLVDCIDYENSRLELSENFQKKYIAKRLKLKQEIAYDIFSLPKEIYIPYYNIVVSEEVKEKIEQARLRGISFYPIEYATEMLCIDWRIDIEMLIKSSSKKRKGKKQSYINL